MYNKKEAIETINGYLNKYALLLVHLETVRDNEELLSKFLYLDTLKEQLEEAGEPLINDLAQRAFAIMTIAAAEGEKYPNNKKGPE